MCLKEFQIVRPNGSVVYKCMTQEHSPPLLIGQIHVVDGKIVLSACFNEEDPEGSVIHPACSVVAGDALEFRIDDV